VSHKDLVLLDLFSGIGGFHEGFHRAGFEFSKVYFSEIDKYAIGTYKYNFQKSNIEHIGDISTIQQRGIKLEPPNIITFGFPCQDLSIAGNGAGFDGSRSVLFFEAVKLIKQYKPDIFIFENVKGLLSNNGGKTLEVVLRTIAELNLYECEGQLLNTKWVLPQNRERVYFVGHSTKAGRSFRKVFPITENEDTFRKRNKTAETQSQAQYCTTLKPKFGTRSDDTFIATSAEKPIQVNPSTECGGTQPFMQNRIYDTKGIAGAIPAQLTEMYKIADFRGDEGLRIREDDIAPTLQARAREDEYGVPMILKLEGQHPNHEWKEKNEAGSLKASNFNNNRSTGTNLVIVGNNVPSGHEAGNIYSDKGIAPTVREMHGKVTKVALSEEIQCADFRGDEGLRIRENGLSPALQGKDFKEPKMVIKGSTIRRLTPVECERLQGFPDNWTKYRIDEKGNVVENSDSQRYKMCGNAVTVDIVEMIAKKL